MHLAHVFGKRHVSAISIKTRIVIDGMVALRVRRLGVRYAIVQKIEIAIILEVILSGLIFQSFHDHACTSPECTRC